MGCVVSMSLLSLGITMMFFSPFLPCPLPPPNTGRYRQLFFLQILLVFSLPICRKEGDQKDGWYDKIKSDFLTV